MNEVKTNNSNAELMTNLREQVNKQMATLTTKIPTYSELSEEGKKIVEEHLNNCDSCRKEYEILRSSIEIDTVDATKINYLKKVNLKLLITIISLLVVTIISSMLLTFYTESNFDEGTMTLLFDMFVFILIIIKYVIPLFGMVFSIIYL